MASIFTRIINGEIPCYKLAETEDYFSFLDIRPMAKGHALVIPKKEVDYIFDLDDDYLIGLHLFAKKVAKALEATVPCKRIGIAVIDLLIEVCQGIFVIFKCHVGSSSKTILDGLIKL